MLPINSDRSENTQSNASVRQSKESPGDKEWDALLRQMQSAKLSAADMRIIRNLKSGGEGELYRLLFMGCWEGASLLRKQGPYRSRLQAVQAMLNRLVRLTNGDPCRMYAIFKVTALYGCDEIKNHRTYLVRTILTAIDGLNLQQSRASTGGRGRCLSPQETTRPVLPHRTPKAGKPSA